MEYARAYLGKHAPEASRLMIPRFYCSFPLAPGAVVELPAEAAHHAVKVLRLSAGDTVILFDGRGGRNHANQRHRVTHIQLADAAGFRGNALPLRARREENIFHA